MTSDLISFEGTISRITFSAKDSGYTIFKLKVEDKGYAQPITIVGVMSNPSEGQQVRVTGQWTTHAKYGRQIKAERIEEVLPKTLDGIQAFLGSGLIKGIGPKTAEKVVQLFGVETLAVLEKAPHRLTEITGFSDKKIQRVTDGWQKYQSIRDVMMFLQGHGISTAYAFRIFKVYGNDCAKVLKENPYQLADDVWGIGFKMADRIAQQMGVAMHDPKRIRSGVIYILQQVATQGHTLMLKADLVQTAQAMLEVTETEIEMILPTLLAAKDIYQISYEDQTALALKKFYQIEKKLHEILTDQKRSWKQSGNSNLSKFEIWLGQYKVKNLTHEQNQAILTIAQSPMTILTGGPGCGKTTALHALVRMMKTFGKKVICCAPTGRASRRMEEVIGLPSKTIHRLLEYDPQKREFVRRDTFPLIGDFLIVDESSMVDVELALALMLAVPKTMQVVWVGDQDQLPSVGPGQFLGDLIDLHLCEVAKLTQVFRQEGRSQIVVNSHRVNEGEFPYLNTQDQGKDFYYIEKTDPEQIQAAVVECMIQRIPDAFGISSHDIKVLTPMHKGIVGTTQFNQILQSKLNPYSTGDEFISIFGERRFFKGDRVLQKVNNYNLDLMNGEIGTIQSIQRQTQEAIIRFEDRDVTCDAGDLQDLELGYALSIHKSQGSEFPAVIIPIHESQYVMLHRTLLYTAMTRARKLCVLIGSKRAIAMAVKRTGLNERRTLLPIFGKKIGTA